MVLSPVSSSAAFKGKNQSSPFDVGLYAHFLMAIQSDAHSFPHIHLIYHSQLPQEHSFIPAGLWCQVIFSAIAGGIEIIGLFYFFFYLIIKFFGPSIVIVPCALPNPVSEPGSPGSTALLHPQCSNFSSPSQGGVAGCGEAEGIQSPPQSGAGWRGGGGGGVRGWASQIGASSVPLFQLHMFNDTRRNRHFREWCV